MNYLRTALAGSEIGNPADRGTTTRSLELLSTPTHTVGERRRSAVASALDAIAEDGGVLVFRGLPGSGVTRLLRLVAEEGAARSMRTLSVAFDPYESVVPYAGIDLLCRADPALRPLAEELRADADPIHLARRLLECSTDDGPRRLLLLDDLSACDPESRAVLRYAIPRLRHHGVIIAVGAHLSAPTELEGQLLRMADVDGAGRIFDVPNLRVDDIVSLIRERAGVGVGRTVAERIGEDSHWRLGVVNAQLAGLSADDLDSLAETRSLPTLLAARLYPHDTIELDLLPRSARFAAQVIALARTEIAQEVVERFAAHLGLHFDGTDAADGVLVVKDAATGTLHLRDPLIAAEVRDATPPARRRALHGLLADTTYGITAFRHRVEATVRFDEAEAAEIIATAAAFEERGEGHGAVRVLDVASRLAEFRPGGAPLRRAFGLACIRQYAGIEYQSRLPDFAPTASHDPVAGYVYASLRTLRAHGHLDGQGTRLAYLAAPPVDVDHEFLQAEIAYVEFLSAFQIGGPAVAAAAAPARERLRALRGRRPEADDLQWLDPEGHLLVLDAFELWLALGTGRIEPVDAVDRARAIVATAGAMAEASVQAVEALTLAAGVLSRAQSSADADSAIREARDRSERLTRPPLVPGQLDCIEAETAMTRGDWERSRTVLAAAYPRSHDGLDMPSRIAVPAMLAWFSAVDGEIDTARRYAAQAASADRYGYRGQGEEFLALALAELRRQTEGIDAAIAELDAAVHEGGAAALRIHAMRAHLITIRDASGADLVEAVAGWRAVRDATCARTEGFAWLEGIVLLADGDPEGALRRLRHGAANSESRFVRGACSLVLARLLDTMRGSPAEVSRAFADAAAGFAAVGARHYAELSRSMAEERAGLVAARIASLTARERQVAELGMRGWTNREISVELRIGVATVAFHMSNALEKLAIGRRTELAGVLGRSG